MQAEMEPLGSQHLRSHDVASEAGDQDDHEPEHLFSGDDPFLQGEDMESECDWEQDPRIEKKSFDLPQIEETVDQVSESAWVSLPPPASLSLRIRG